MNGHIWILVADSNKARIYAAYKAKLFLPEANENTVALVSEFNHPASRKHDRELVSDSSGRYRSTGVGSDTFDTPTDPKRHEEDIFAAQLCKVLHEGFYAKKFEELILIAPPVFLGMLNKHAARMNGLANAINVTVEKDYIDLNERELVKQLQTHI
ncbi:MAG: hypothetical protein A3F10_00050 [Coxiella sp. RIFCSPHIGHO2_12_FULL_42_15]|nr:MAG: hypothetical protein A3F10_00050 [Coxiella sp. RIFCSPHIGHO2_12_FULL_42_15]